MSEKLHAQCHCGAVAFTVELTDGFNTLRRCNCSFCRMRGAVAVSAQLSGLEVTRGKEKLTEYRFNTQAAAHYFCSVCGIYTFNSAAPTRSNLALMSPALKAFPLSIFRSFLSWMACITPKMAQAMALWAI